MMIKKPAIIITSLGRTGTRFFATMLREVIPDVTSLHEPDVFQIVVHGQKSAKIARSIERVQEQIREVGFGNLVIRKALGQWSLIRLSDARVRSELGYTEAVQCVLGQRGGFVQSRDGSVYVESNVGYYGLIDVLKDVYENHRIAYIIRDGRDWVQSNMNWGEMYGKSRIRSLVAHTWPTASEIKGDPYEAKWRGMSRFERLCWAWARLNEYTIGTIQENPNARAYRFEDIFESEERYQHLKELMRFVTGFPNLEPMVVGSSEGWLDKKIHRSPPRFPHWKEWTPDQRQQFEALCGPLMRRLGYELD